MCIPFKDEVPSSFNTGTANAIMLVLFTTGDICLMGKGF